MSFPWKHKSQLTYNLLQQIKGDRTTFIHKMDMKVTEKVCFLVTSTSETQTLALKPNEITKLCNMEKQVWVMLVTENNNRLHF